MTGTHQEQLIDHLRILMFFIEFNLLLYLIFSHKTAEPSTCPASITITQHPPPPPRRRRKPQNQLVLPWILQREERGCYRTLLDELITTDVPGYRNSTRMKPASFDLIEERITSPRQEVNHQLQEVTESWLESGSYFGTLIDRESYTSVQYHWMVGRLTICKFVPHVCKAILKEFQVSGVPH